MATLYEIDERLKALEEYGIDLETGELLSDEEFNQLFDEIQMALTDKIENTICFIKNLESDVEAFKAEEEKIKARRKSKEVLAERLKNRIGTYIARQFINEDGTLNGEQLNKYKFETPKCKLSYRKSETVEVDCAVEIPQEYLKIKTETSIDKTAIKNAIKKGIEVNGAILKTNYNMQIK